MTRISAHCYHHCRTRWHMGIPALLLALASPFLLFAGGGAEPSEATDPPPPDPLAALGFEVTGGAAPGYVEDRACAMCHGELWASYQEVGMARSFTAPRAEAFIENFEDNRFYHQPSERWYEMERDGDRLTFRRWQLDGEGRRVHVFEREVDWILGSGHTSRVYLYQTADGELFQLPLAWYSQNAEGRATETSGHWGMAPGFDQPDHLGVQRPVLRECMFCHNAYPDVPEGSDTYGQPHLFPAELPEGLGCQRCHGPGAEHVRAALTGAADGVEELRSTVVNPAKLPPARRDSVCYQCHFQPTVALPGVRRFGRPVYSFRPGELLSDYLVKVDVTEEGRSRSERFEINHHPYRLEQSRCFRESRSRAKGAGGENGEAMEALSCLTCHDPHRKVPEPRRAAHYRQACLGCHQVEACQLEEMDAPAGFESVDPQNCIGCHMPRRRTQDVVQVVMTDHRIQRIPPGPERLVPLEERDPVILDVELLAPAASTASAEGAEGALPPPKGALAEVYRTASLIRAGTVDPATVEHLEKALAAARPESITPYLDLARGLLRVRRTADAEAALRRVLARDADNVRALSWMGIALAGQGKGDEALAFSRKALEAEPRRAESHFNLGRLLLGYGRPGEALPALEKAVELRPTLVLAWYYLGRTHEALEEPAKAREAYEKALAVEPSFARAREALEAHRRASDAE